MKPRLMLGVETGSDGRGAGVDVKGKGSSCQVTSPLGYTAQPTRNPDRVGGAHTVICKHASNHTHHRPHTQLRAIHINEYFKLLTGLLAKSPERQQAADMLFSR
jgi:hypothetical protein